MLLQILNNKRKEKLKVSGTMGCDQSTTVDTLRKFRHDFTNKVIDVISQNLIQVQDIERNNIGLVIKLSKMATSVKGENLGLKNAMEKAMEKSTESVISTITDVEFAMETKKRERNKYIEKTVQLVGNSSYN